MIVELVLEAPFTCEGRMKAARRIVELLVSSTLLLALLVTLACFKPDITTMLVITIRWALLEEEPWLMRCIKQKGSKMRFSPPIKKMR